MSTARFSHMAKADLLSIGVFTIQNWGAAQAERYLDGLEKCAQMLARNPAVGRRCDWIRPGLRRFEKGRHVIFYRLEQDCILVARILHQGMLPDQQAFEEMGPEA